MMFSSSGCPFEFTIATCTWLAVLHANMFTCLASSGAVGTRSTTLVINGASLIHVAARF